MITLKEAFINKNTIKNISIYSNKFGVTEKDMIGELKGFPLGIVVRMLEETEKQGNKPDIKVFQKDKTSSWGNGGFYWDNTEAKYSFWDDVILSNKFDKFYKKYPEYKKYDKQ